MTLTSQNTMYTNPLLTLTVISSIFATDNKPIYSDGESDPIVISDCTFYDHVLFEPLIRLVRCTGNIEISRTCFFNCSGNRLIYLQQCSCPVVIEDVTYNDIATVSSALVITMSCTGVLTLKMNNFSKM